jgi:hypothetical protein
MKNPTLTEIRKDVEAKGGTYKKLKAALCGQDAYQINGSIYSRAQLIEHYRHLRALTFFSV